MLKNVENKCVEKIVENKLLKKNSQAKYLLKTMLKRKVLIKIVCIAYIAFLCPNVDLADAHTSL